MSAAAGATGRAASLLEIDPVLGLLLGPRAAATVGRRPLLPVFDVAAGPWSPPAAEGLGDRAFAVAVLDGALLCEPPVDRGALLGPGDLMEPWSRGPARWTACTPVRLAVIGGAFLDAIEPWPLAAARIVRRASDVDGPAGLPARAAASRPAEDRLTAVLWRLAARWGELERDGMAVPLAVAPAVLAALAEMPPERAAGALGSLERAHAATRRPDGTWLLWDRPEGSPPGRGLRARGDFLREQVAASLARARAGRDLAAEIIEDAAAQVERGRRRRAVRARTDTGRRRPSSDT